MRGWARDPQGEREGPALFGRYANPTHEIGVVDGVLGRCDNLAWPQRTEGRGASRWAVETISYLKTRRREECHGVVKVPAVLRECRGQIPSDGTPEGGVKNAVAC